MLLYERETYVIVCVIVTLIHYGCRHTSLSCIRTEARRSVNGIKFRHGHTNILLIEYA